MYCYRCRSGLCECDSDDPEFGWDYEDDEIKNDDEIKEVNDER